MYCYLKENNAMANSQYQLSGPSQWRVNLTACSYFSTKFLRMANKIREAGEEHQFRSHCVVIKDQGSLQMPASLHKRLSLASTRCCNVATGDVQPFKQIAKYRHFKTLYEKPNGFNWHLERTCRSKLQILKWPFMSFQI